MIHVAYTFAPIRDIGETDVTTRCSCNLWSSTEPEAEHPGSDVTGYTAAGDAVRSVLYDRFVTHWKEAKRAETES